MNTNPNFIQKAVEAGGRLRVKSALNPILWLCAIVTIPGMGYMLVAESETPMLIQIIISLPVVTAVLGFAHLLLFDRDKLQSEDYQIRKRTLDLVQEKGDEFPAIARTLEVITNPALNAISHDEREDQE